MFNYTEFTAKAEGVIIAKNTQMQIVKGKCLHQDPSHVQPAATQEACLAWARDLTIRLLSIRSFIIY